MIGARPRWLLCLALLGCDDGTPAPRQPRLPEWGAIADAGDAGTRGSVDASAPQDAAPTIDADLHADAALPDAALPDASPPPTLDGWALVWHDEFDGAEGTPPHPTRWVHDVGGDGWGNDQLEYDTDRLENAAHDGAGHLVLTAREERLGGRDYTSARIKTQGLFAQRYGRVEARIQLPIGQGMWPAFWMLGDDIGDVGWPFCGEIDVMEFRGQRPRQSTGALHGPGYSGGSAFGGAYDAPTPLPDDFHLFAVEWDAAGITWTVDDEVFLTATPADLPPGTRWVYDHPFFLILNLAVGGSYVGSPDATTPFPQRLRVDFVRVWQADP